MKYCQLVDCLPLLHYKHVQSAMTSLYNSATDLGHPLAKKESLGLRFIHTARDSARATFQADTVKLTGGFARSEAYNALTKTVLPRETHLASFLPDDAASVRCPSSPLDNLSGTPNGGPNDNDPQIKLECFTLEKHC